MNATGGCVRFSLQGILCKPIARRGVEHIQLPDGSDYTGSTIVQDGCLTPHGDGRAEKKHGVVIDGMWARGLAQCARVTSSNSCSVVEMKNGQTNGMALSVWTSIKDRLDVEPLIQDCNIWWGLYVDNVRCGSGMLISHVATCNDSVERIMEIGRWEKGIMLHGQRCHSSGNIVCVMNRHDTFTRPHSLVSPIASEWVQAWNALGIPCQVQPMSVTQYDRSPDMVLPIDMQMFSDLVHTIQDVDVCSWTETSTSMPEGRYVTFVYCYNADVHASIIPSLNAHDVETVRAHASSIQLSLEGFNMFQIVMLFGNPMSYTKAVLYRPVAALDPVLVQVHACACGRLTWSNKCVCGSVPRSSSPHLERAGINGFALSSTFTTTI